MAVLHCRRTGENQTSICATKTKGVGQRHHGALWQRVLRSVPQQLHGLRETGRRFDQVCGARRHAVVQSQNREQCLHSPSGAKQVPCTRSVHETT